MKTILFILLISIPSIAFGQKQKTGANPNKTSVVQSVDRHQSELITISDKIWAYAETALREKKSAKELADYAEAQGFRVKRGLAGMPTAFTAEFGSGKPIIGIMGEFDALP